VARVPTVDSPTVQRAGLPSAQFEAPREIGTDIAARQGAALTQAGNQLLDTTFKIQQQEIDYANQLRVDDAVNQAREAAAKLTYDPQQGYTTLKGQAALQRPNGQSLADDYGGQLQTSFSNIAGALGNDAQRQQFARQSAGILQGFRNGLMQHENAEFRGYANSVREGTIANRLDDIGRNYNNPDVIDESVGSIRAATYDLAKLNGKSAEWAEAQVKRQVSNAHFTAIQAALQSNDPIYADQYMKKYADQMDANDILKANGLITKEADAKIGQAAATQVMVQNQSSMVPTDFQRLTNLVIGQESRGQRYAADGQLLTSPKGAKGEMQVLDSTNTNPGFGVKPAQDDTPDERARVGRDYLQAMLQKYQGNVPQGLAAYNAGPGAVDAAVREANKNGTPQQWLAYLPKETQTYVSRIMGGYNAGGGTPARPTLEDIHRQVEDTLGPTASPQRRAIARETATRQYNEQTAAIKQREDQAVENVQRQLIANGGNFAALPSDVRASIPPGQFDNMMAFAGKLAKGVPIETNWDLYYDLRRDPQVLARTNLGALRNQLADTEYKQLVGLQTDLKAGKDDVFTRLQSADGILKQFIKEAGINPNAKPGTDDAKTVGRLTAAYSQRLQAQEAATGKKTSEAEQRAIAAQIFTQVEVDRPFWLDKKTPAGAVTDQQTVVIPKDQVKLIDDALRQRGYPINDTTRQQLYRRSLGVTPLANNG